MWNEQLDDFWFEESYAEVAPDPWDDEDFSDLED